MIPRWMYVVLALTGLSYFLAGFVASYQKSNRDAHDQDEVVLRSIGHRLLVSLGDDSSRILPIEKKSIHEYLIRFEKVFSFNPDTLVEIVRSNLGGQAFNQDYIFQVLECREKEIVYSFSVQADSSETLIPCLGRQLPEACYILRVVFQPGKADIKWYAILLLPFLLSLGFMWQRKKGVPEIVNHSRPDPPASESAPAFLLGQFQFIPREQCLYFRDTKIPLSVKENELLILFTQSPNQLLPRDYLLKTIWEDQGVFTGRSLDVFVSKLRKKLVQDPGIQLISVHGKGYRMEVRGSDE